VFHSLQLSLTGVQTLSALKKYLTEQLVQTLFFQVAQPTFAGVVVVA
jgi:hypothetical protein